MCAGSYRFGVEPVRRVRTRLSLREGENTVATEEFVQLPDSIFRQHRHICAFFNSIDEQHRVLRPFI